jgi:hypothetical protein
MKNKKLQQVGSDMTCYFIMAKYFNGITYTWRHGTFDFWNVLNSTADTSAKQSNATYQLNWIVRARLGTNTSL